MVTTQEIIERSVYLSILNTSIKHGLSINPENYLPPTVESEARYKADVENIKASGKPYVMVFGAGNSQSRGIKEVPRIVIEPQGFFPGDIGFDKESIDRDENGDFLVSESNYSETVDQFINIHLVSNNIEDNRLLHNVLSSSIPQKGYIKPYNHENKPFTGNIFIILSNFFNLNDNDKGIIEKVYQFTIMDTVLEELFIPTGETHVPIKDISILLNELDKININK